MKTITFTNQKGGTGKTTTSTHTALSLIKEGYRVAFLDADGQANASSFLKKYKSNITATDFFTKSIGSIENTSLTLIEGGQALFSIKNISTELLGNVKKIDAAGYDYMIIDTSPALSIVSLACLTISDGVFIPIEMSKFALEDGVKQTMNNIRYVKEKNGSKAKLMGLIPNKVIGLSKKQKMSLGHLSINHPGKILPYLSVRVPYVDTMNGQTPIWNILPMAGNIKTASIEMARLMNAIILKISQLTEEKDNA